MKPGLGRAMQCYVPRNSGGDVKRRQGGDMDERTPGDFIITKSKS